MSYAESGALTLLFLPIQLGIILTFDTPMKKSSEHRIKSKEQWLEEATAFLVSVRTCNPFSDHVRLFPVAQCGWKVRSASRNVGHPAQDMGACHLCIPYLPALEQYTDPLHHCLVVTTTSVRIRKAITQMAA